jgi:type IV secretory pathway VirB3-like protein
MLAAILRLIALRPILTMAVLGIPIIILVAVGLITIMALKFLVFIVLPIVVVVWVVRKLFYNHEPPTSA